MRALVSRPALSLLALGAFSSALSSGCAPTYPKTMYTTFGVADPEKDEKIETSFSENVGDELTRESDVVVLIDTLPKGLSYSEGALSVEDGFKHEVVGKFEFRLSGIHYFTASFVPYEDGWRKGLCYWQVPLQWVTMGVWSAVPTDYPCHPEFRRKKSSLIGDARVIAFEAGGDTVIMSYLHDESQRAMGANGFVIKLDAGARSEDGKLETEPLKLESD